MNQYSIILADPPWSFRTWSDKGKDRSAEKHYPVLSMDELKHLPIAAMAKDNSILLLWAISPLLPEIISLMSCWGFTYKTVAFVWAKTCRKTPHKFHTGLGYYTRANAEYCLLGTRGKGLTRLSKSVRQLVVSPIGRHSEKPEIIKDKIVELFGDIKRIELFARRITPGWDVIGLDLTGDDIRDVILR